MSNAHLAWLDRLSTPILETLITRVGKSQNSHQTIWNVASYKIWLSKISWIEQKYLKSGLAGGWIWGWGQYPQHVKTGNSLRRRNYGDAATNKSIFAHSKKNIILGIKKYNCKFVPRFIVYWKESKYNFVKASLTKLKVVFQCKLSLMKNAATFSTVIWCSATFWETYSARFTCVAFLCQMSNFFKAS